LRSILLESRLRQSATAVARLRAHQGVVRPILGTKFILTRMLPGVACNGFSAIRVPNHSSMIHRLTARQRSTSSTERSVAPKADSLNCGPSENKLTAQRIARCDYIHAKRAHNEARPIIGVAFTPKAAHTAGQRRIGPADGAPARVSVKHRWKISRASNMRSKPPGQGSNGYLPPKNNPDGGKAAFGLPDSDRFSSTAASQSIWPVEPAVKHRAGQSTHAYS
jgi:hypothetical protein